MKKFKLGFIINPVAGIGGSVALKGSDGMAKQAIELGAVPQANARASYALEVLTPYKNDIVILTASGSMGEQCALALGFSVEVIHQCIIDKTQSTDTQLTAQTLLTKGVDIILFAGGDGTARDIAGVVTTGCEYQPIPVLGIPAGCKIHSGVYAITPKAAGRVVELMVTKQLVSLASGDVMDIDEDLFRQGIVKAKRYSEMQIPSELRYVQAVKSGGKESDELVLQDIAANVIEEMHDFDDRQFIIGSGSTTAFVMAELGLDNTLLGVDIVIDQTDCAADVTESDVFKAITAFEGVSKLVITLIGGQGHIFGRGNQQLSPRVIRAIIAQPGGRDNIMILATKAKLAALASKPLISDTGDATLDQELSGFMTVTTGYKDHVLYPLSSPE
jgi:predicted polyphosphate/ATP-dependent NAD kinase